MPWGRTRRRPEGSAAGSLRIAARTVSGVCVRNFGCRLLGGVLTMVAGEDEGFDALRRGSACPTGESPHVIRGDESGSCTFRAGAAARLGK